MTMASLTIVIGNNCIVRVADDIDDPVGIFHFVLAMVFDDNRSPRGWIVKLPDETVGHHGPFAINTATVVARCILNQLSSPTVLKYN